MEPRDATLDALWNQLWELEQLVHRGGDLELTGDVRNLLLRAAPTVALGEAEAMAALLSVEGAIELLGKIRARVREGSHRLGNALHRMYRLQEQGKLDEARQQMRDLLSVEVVPLYREIAEGELEKMEGAS
ncbi:DUSAM domain-containing protein [Hyalangium minutum]|uniref:DUSAM domain-containing protein n=1 Tax=Hyalangium minutum TaxID=394096 RepID=A0A085W5L8_9BACT|nr:DUSAM domain-containing protein [Hyalangium minutum]KFE62981.1 hypothetical protein DB31_3040 [Hyalangium minutum]